MSVNSLLNVILINNPCACILYTLLQFLNFSSNSKVNNCITCWGISKNYPGASHSHGFCASSLPLNVFKTVHYILNVFCILYYKLYSFSGYKLKEKYNSQKGFNMNSKEHILPIKNAFTLLGNELQENPP